MLASFAIACVFQDFLLSLFQTNDVDLNQWVVLDLGQTSSVCGIVTQGRGEKKSQHEDMPRVYMQRSFIS